MPDTTIKQLTDIDIDRLAATGREVIKAREAKTKEEAERREAERIKERRQAWEPYLRNILGALAKWLPVDGAERVGLDIVGQGWSITVPPGPPYVNGMYYPVGLHLDGCTTIRCWIDKEGATAFEAEEPELDFDYGEYGWHVETACRPIGRGLGHFIDGESDLPVAIAHAKASHGRMQELLDKAKRRNENQILPFSTDPEPRPQAVDYLKEAKNVQATLSEIDGPSTGLFQAGVLAALIAIGEELRIRHY